MRRLKLRELASDDFYDVFLCCSSFEERCLSVPKSLTAVQVGLALVCRNEGSVPDVEEHARAIESHFGKAAYRVKLRRTDPLFSADSMRHVLDRNLGRHRTRVLVDITTFTHEALLMLLSLLRRYAQSGCLIHLAYATAKDYSSGLPDSEKWLSKGIREIHSVLGYPGQMVPSRKAHLIVLVGFEAERAQKLIDTYEPTILSLGYGIHQNRVTDGDHQVNRLFYMAVAERYKRFDEFQFDPYDALASKEAIQAQVRKAPDNNTIVASMNTKISTIGAALSAFENEDIQLCYASAMHYNVNYSVPGDECFVLDYCDLLSR
jgi:hypothetical protein